MKNETPEEHKVNIKRCYEWIEKASIEEVEEIYAKQTKKELVQSMAGMAKLLSEWKLDDEGHYVFSKTTSKPIESKKKVVTGELKCSVCGSAVDLPLWAEHFRKGLDEYFSRRNE